MTTPASARTLTVSRGLMLVLGGFVLAPWILLLVAVKDIRTTVQSSRPAEPASASDVPAPAETIDEGTLFASPGPWGRIAYTRILIEPPEELVGRSRQTTQPIRWIFTEFTAGDLTALWRSANLPDNLVSELDAPANRIQTSNRFELRIPHSVILALTPEARAIIYDVLARSPENDLHAEPFRFRADAVDEWFADSAVPPATIELVKRLLYRRGPAVLFSDLDVVLAGIPSFDDRTTLIKTLARKSTLLVRLEVDDKTDLDALSDYWGRGLRSKDVKPLLHSLRRPGVTTRIDIAHLLPRFARARLYSYPSIGGDDAALAFMDCHWTSMNFFNLEPDPRFQNIDVVSETLFNDYRSVTGKSALGDVLLLARQDGSIVHSCVYIADDIVFTKNGVSAAAPWILMNLADVMAIYPSKEPLDIQRYRLKSLP